MKFLFNRILVKFNVNHTVDAEEDLELDNQQQAQQEAPKLLSKPNFEIDIKKGDTTLSLSCTYLSGQPAEGEYGNIDFFFTHFNNSKEKKNVQLHENSKSTQQILILILLISISFI